MRPSCGSRLVGKDWESDHRKRTYRAMENHIADGSVNAESSCESKTAYTAGGLDRALKKLRQKGKRSNGYHCRFCDKYHVTTDWSDR